MSYRIDVEYQPDNDTDELPFHATVSHVDEDGFTLNDVWAPTHEEALHRAQKWIAARNAQRHIATYITDAAGTVHSVRV